MKLIFSYLAGAAAMVLFFVVSLIVIWKMDETLLENYPNVHNSLSYYGGAFVLLILLVGIPSMMISDYKAKRINADEKILLGIFSLCWIVSVVLFYPLVIHAYEFTNANGFNVSALAADGQAIRADEHEGGVLLKISLIIPQVIFKVLLATLGALVLTLTAGLIVFTGLMATIFGYSNYHKAH